jgi:hypothetical protein
MLAEAFVSTSVPPEKYWGYVGVKRGLMIIFANKRTEITGGCGRSS